MGKPRIMIVDDNLEMARTLAQNLEQHGFTAEAVRGGLQGIARFLAAPADVVVTDLRMEGADGMDVLDAIKKSDPSVPIIIMTAFGAIDTAVEAIRRGAYHYLTKPFKMDVLRLFVERAVAKRALLSENRRLREVVEERLSFANLVGGSTAMKQLFSLVERVAGVTNPVLLYGETGTGKELVARAIHSTGPRATGPFVAVNCAALPEALLESELFGHARGAFTGATQLRRGLFLEADGGTLLLDEIGDMALSLQAKLLRVLESGEIRPLGSDTTRTCDVRVIAATHRNLEEQVDSGKFREDLYFRLKVLPVRLPTLRERREDIPLLAEHFLKHARAKNPGGVVESIPAPAMRLLIEHSWPGNVRELKHVIESLVITGSQAAASAEIVASAIGPAAREPHPLDRAKRDLQSLRDLEQAYIAWVLDHTQGNRTRAAEILGIDPSTIYRRRKTDAHGHE